MTSRIEDAQSMQAQMVEVRRHLHRHPEVGLALPHTHDYVLGSLRALGFDVETHPFAGLTVRVPGLAPDGTTSVLRADMDALPLSEFSDRDFASVNDGAMHACGHDLHMAMLLGAAEVLAHKPPLRDVVLVFQPGEETDRGAMHTLQHHNLARLAGPATAFALHVNAVLPAHTVNYRRDTFMAHGDWFQVDFHGEGGHASRPELTGNPIEAASRFVHDVRALAEGLSRDEGVVATVTECIMGNTVNVIPTDGRLRGTIRTLSAGQRDRLIEGLQAITRRSGEHARVRGAFTLHEGYPAVVSDPTYVDEMVVGLARTKLAPRVREMAEPSMVIEDFAYFLHRWPGTMVYLGAQVPGRTAFNHSAEVLFDEDVLATGAALLLMAADGWSTGRRAQEGGA